jgi:hypothetical protein
MEETATQDFICGKRPNEKPSNRVTDAEGNCGLNLSVFGYEKVFSRQKIPIFMLNTKSRHLQLGWAASSRSVGVTKVLHHRFSTVVVSSISR